MTKGRLGSASYNILRKLRNFPKSSLELSLLLDLPSRTVTDRVWHAIEKGWVKRVRRGVYEITEKGLERLQEEEQSW